MGELTGVILQTIGDTRGLVIDVKNVIANAFDLNTAHIDTVQYNAQVGNKEQATANISSITKKTTTKWGSSLYGNNDAFGRQIYCPITITTAGVDYNFPGVVLGLKAPVIHKETPMVERGGAVIEEVALGAVRFSVRGVLFGQYGQYPDDELAALAALRLSKEPKYLKSPLSDLFMTLGDQVVMLDLEIAEKTVSANLKAFRFDLIESSILDLTTTT